MVVNFIEESLTYIQLLDMMLLDMIKSAKDVAY